LESLNGDMVAASCRSVLTQVINEYIPLLTENKELPIDEGKSSKKDPYLSLTKRFFEFFLFTVFNTASSANLSLYDSVSVEAGGWGYRPATVLNGKYKDNLSCTFL
jgi:hypothetical protein